MPVHYVKTWSMRWDDVLRDVLYRDEELAHLMLIPKNTNIVTWIDKYFVDAAICTELVTDEDVRVLWWEDQSSKTSNPLVNQRKLVFDIYVKADHLRDATNDLLRPRTKIICQKLVEI